MSPNVVEWSTVGPMLIGGLAVVIWSLVRGPWRALEALRRDLAENYARREDVRQLRTDLQAALGDVAFRLDRHEENSTARWVNHPNAR